MQEEARTTIQSPGDNEPQKKSRESRSNRLGRIIATGVLVFFFGVGFFLSVFPLGRSSIRAALLLPSLVTGAEPGIFRVVDEPVSHTQTTVQSEAGTVNLDIYAPTTPVPAIPGEREAFLIIPGVGDNRHEPQLINLSQSLAGAGIVVMDMTTPTLLNYDLSVKDGDAVVQAFQKLAHWPGVGSRRIGIIGFSAGDALACFAAADARIRDQVAFIALFGGYFNATSLLRAMGRRALLVDGQLQPWHPQDVPLQVLANVIAADLPPSDGSILVRSFSPGGKPLTPDQLLLLAPASASAYHLLAGDEPNQVDTNLTQFTPQMHALLDELSPSRVIGGIRTPIYLLHDRNDQFVPFTESRDFAQALANIHHRYEFTEFGIFQHVEVRANPGLSQLLADGAHLFAILDQLMLVGS